MAGEGVLDLLSEHVVDLFLKVGGALSRGQACGGGLTLDGRGLGGQLLEHGGEMGGGVHQAAMGRAVSDQAVVECRPFESGDDREGDAETEQQQRLKELAAVFFRLGCIAFGGPAAHIAMMDDEVVKRRQWMSREQLLDLIGVTNLLPGPNSTELAIHIGYERAGWKGLFVAGSCFIAPAMAIVWILAALYARYQAVPQVEWLLYGIKPVIIAIILQALFKLGKKAIKDIPTTIAAIAVIAAFFLNVNEILLLLLAGLAVMLFKNLRGSTTALLLPLSGTLAQTGGTAAAATAVTSPSWIQVFLFFLKIYLFPYILLNIFENYLVTQRRLHQIYYLLKFLLFLYCEFRDEFLLRLIVS